MSNGKPRRRSIFSGLLLVMVGVFFLVSNLRPDLNLWERFAGYWPVLLIIWGLSKMFDYFAARQSGDPAPSAFTGGEFFLLILLFVFGLSISGIDWLRKNPNIDWDLGPFDNRFSFSEEATRKEIKPGSQITVATDRGNITVLPEDNAEIHVVAQKTVRSSSSEDVAQRRANELKVEIRDTTGGYEVRMADKSQEGRAVSVDLEVHVPRQCSVEARTEHGDIKINGLAGGVIADTRRGGVEIRDIAKDVQAQMRGGSVQISGVKGNVQVSGRGDEIDVSDVSGTATVEGEFMGPIRFKNVTKGGHFVSMRTDLTLSALPGRLELASGDLELYDATGSVTLNTSKKDIRMENITGRIHIDNRGGNVDLRFKTPPKDEIEVNNDSGNVEFSLPANATFEIVAASRSGNVESDFQGTELKHTDQEGSSKLEGKIGARGPQFRVKTSYGTVSLRKSS